MAAQEQGLLVPGQQLQAGHPSLHTSMPLNACVLLLKCRRAQQLSSHTCQDPA